MCGTIVPGDKGKKGEQLLQRIMTTTYEKCRAKSISIGPFPDFEPVVNELNSTTADNSLREKALESFKVTTLLPCGSLVVKEQFLKQFQEGDEEIPGFNALIEKHNEKYNVEGIRLRDIESAQPVQAPPQEDSTCEIIQTEQPLTHEKLNAMGNLYLPKFERLKDVICSSCKAS